VKSIIANLNKRFDNKVRLGIMSLLMVEEWVEFTRIKQLLELTDGRLASHVKVLEDEGFITLKKEFVGRLEYIKSGIDAISRRDFGF